ncbi:DNA repair protein RadC [Lachnospiraceae bacterium PM6-15]|uniref:JAB domain-containing protein n=1 Tax=Ohessyouella blattaphilus TaxID=2949333 RepID=UPI003E1BEB39
MSEINGVDLVNVRLVKESTLYYEKPITSAEDVVRFMADELALYDREVMCVLNLNTKGGVLNMNIVSMGTINASLVSPREVFKASILSNANSIIICHNHPSGVPTPSRDDIRLTQRLKEAGLIIGIELLDHVIVGGVTGKRFSFLQEGLMDSVNSKHHLEQMARETPLPEKTSRKSKKGRCY